MKIRGNTITIHQEGLPIIGGKMKGPVDMDRHALSGIPVPEEDYHAANKKYVDDEKEKTDKAISDASEAAGKAIADAEERQKKYTDSKHLNPKVELSVDGWTGESEPYTQTVAVEGILSTDEPHYGVVYSGEQDEKQAQKEAFSLIDDLDTSDGSVMFTCFSEKPAVALTIQMEVNR